MTAGLYVKAYPLSLMAEYIKEGETIEGQKCSVKARRVEFKKGGLRKDPVLDRNVVLYELDRNSSVEITESLDWSKNDRLLRETLHIHCEVGDRIQGKSIRLYVDSKRDVLKPIVKEGQSSRHGASLMETNIRTVGRIKTPFDVYKKLLGYSPKSDKKAIETDKK